MAHRGMLGAVTPDLGALSSSTRFGTDRADVMLDRRFGRSAATNRVASRPEGLCGSELFSLPAEPA
jgi:hypothetical protein